MIMTTTAMWVLPLLGIRLTISCHFLWTHMSNLNQIMHKCRNDRRIDFYKTCNFCFDMKSNLILRPQKVSCSEIISHIYTNLYTNYTRVKFHQTWDFRANHEIQDVCHRLMRTNLIVMHYFVKWSYLWWINEEK
jgi:hypothetical protein